jgi:polyisoprenoid-binding protein YceI
MSSRLLQWLGVFAVLAFAGVGVVSLGLVKDRIRLVVMSDSSPSDELAALVRDDVATLRQDVQALTAALNDNLAQLVQGLEDAAVRQEQALASQFRVVAEQQDRIGRDVAGLQTVTRAVTRLESRLERAEGLQAEVLARLAVADPRSAVALSVDRGVSPEAEPEVLVTESKTSPEATPTGSEAAPAVVQVQQADSTEDRSTKGEGDPQPPDGDKPAARSFLTFKLPSSSFSFDRRQAFELIPSLSRVGFDAKSTLHDFSGVTSEVRGEFVGNLAQPEGPWRGVIQCTAAALQTGVEGRDEAMKEHLDTEHNPLIHFEVLQFRPAADGLDVAGQKARGTIEGKMCIRGQERTWSMPVQLSVDASKRLVVEGDSRLSLPDYGVPVPSKLGVISMEPEVRVWVALRFRARMESGR